MQSRTSCVIVFVVLMVVECFMCTLTATTDIPMNTPLHLQQAINTSFAVIKAPKRITFDRYYSKPIAKSQYIVIYDSLDRLALTEQDPCALSAGVEVNWIISDDLQITFGQRKDDWEWNIRHFSLAGTTRSVYSAGEMKVGKDTIDWNLNSGSYSIPMFVSGTSGVEETMNRVSQVWARSTCAEKFKFSNSTSSVFSDASAKTEKLLSTYCKDTVLRNNFIVIMKQGIRINACTQSYAVIPFTDIKVRTAAIGLVGISAAAFFILFVIAGAMYLMEAKKNRSIDNKSHLHDDLLRSNE